MRSRTWIVIVATVVTATGVGLVFRSSRTVQPKHLGFYTPEGYGGFLPKTISRQEARGRKQAAGERPSTSTSTTAESQIRLAYAAAWEKDFRTARARFAAVVETAEKRPSTSTGAIRARGEGEASPEEDAAYQHAVCTAALGETEAAEREYVAFLKQYPESRFVRGALGRIARFHGGNVPKAAETVWKDAMKIARNRAQAREREESLCGPACLAEAFRRSGIQAFRDERPRSNSSSIHKLADEMRTSHEGTSLSAMVEAAKRRGLRMRGLKVTWTGLQSQKLPAVTVTKPGHFVLAEEVGPAGVTVWDPDAEGIGKPGRMSFTKDEWLKAWTGVVLATEKPDRHRLRAAG